MPPGFVRGSVGVRRSPIAPTEKQVIVGGSDEIAIVGRGDDRRPAGGGVLEQADHQPAGGAVEMSGRLVGQQHARRRRQRPRQRHAALLAARQPIGAAVAVLGKADPLQPLIGLGLGLVVADAAQVERQGDVLTRGQVLDQRRVLRDIAEQAPAQPC